MTYPLPAWQDSPSTTTPITASNLLLYNSAINGLADSVEGLQPQLPITTVQTSNYGATANQYVLVSTVSGSVTVSLPAAPPDMTRVGVKQVLRGTPDNFVTVQASGSDTFNTTSGSQTATLTDVNQAATYQYSAASSVWVTVSDDIPKSQSTGHAIAMALALGTFGVCA